LIVVRGADGKFWTPNGRHRLAAAKVLGLRQITALVSPDEGLAFRILALNTEKAHNLKDRSLEAIRMARELARRHKRAKETDYAAELESPELLTLGILYEEDGRFAGGAYSSFLKKVDRWSSRSLAVSLREREGMASRLAAIDAQVKRIVAELQDRGFKSPYLKAYVVARINPVRFHRSSKGDTTPPMALGAALTRMAASAKKFDTTSVRSGELALVAAVSGGGE
jgi:ParB family chromosome partitioning protein